MCILIDKENTVRVVTCKCAKYIESCMKEKFDMQYIVIKLNDMCTYECDVWQWEFHNNYVLTMLYYAPTLL